MNDAIKRSPYALGLGAIGGYAASVGFDRWALLSVVGLTALAMTFRFVRDLRGVQ